MASHRPTYHFMPPQNWMNDPNGLIQWHGVYHLFYQYNPNGAFHGTIHWGHAQSTDLVHWEHLPTALAPTPLGADKDGCWSGCAVDNSGTPMLFYTGVFPEVQCVAISEDMITWQKHPPIINEPPRHFKANSFRDPYVWREGDEWLMVIGSGIQGVGGTVLLYRSPDLWQWEYVGELYTDPNGVPDGAWECPSFFRLGDQYVLIISVLPGATTYYFVGTFENYRFTPQFEGVLNHGLAFYAPHTFKDNRGRRLMFGWVREGRSDDAAIQARWNGAQSLPLGLNLNAEGTLHVEPVPELQTLRGEHHHTVDFVLESDTYSIPNVGRAWEMIAEVEIEDAEAFGITLACSPDEAEQTQIIYSKNMLTVDRTRSSLAEDVHRSTEGGEIALQHGESLRLHIFFDHSILEIFANNRFSLTSRIYPTGEDLVGVKLFALNGGVKIKTLDLWALSSIW